MISRPISVTSVILICHSAKRTSQLIFNLAIHWQINWLFSAMKKKKKKKKNRDREIMENEVYIVDSVASSCLFREIKTTPVPNVTNFPVDK